MIKFYDFLVENLDEQAGKNPNFAMDARIKTLKEQIKKLRASGGNEDMIRSLKRQLDELTNKR
jgi:cell division protein FtsB